MEGDRAARFAEDGGNVRTIKVFFYSIVETKGLPSLSDTLAAIAGKGLADRVISCGGQDIRIDEALTRQFHDGIPYWLFRFSRFRKDNWPGVSTTDAPVKDLELNDDEILSEETSLIYMPSLGRVGIQYNHFGVRISKVKEYLNLATGQAQEAYSFSPVLTEDAWEKYNTKQIVTSIDVTLDGLSAADFAIMNGSGLNESIKESVSAQATMAKMSFSVDARIKQEKLERSWVERLVSAVVSRAGENDSLTVKVKSQEEDAVEIIDLLEARKKAEFDATTIDRTVGRRYNPTQIYGLLEQSMRDWRLQDEARTTV